jgi:hypothetical protein
MQDKEKIYSKQKDRRQRDGVGGNPQIYGRNG